jgi:uncharacterized membrane protein YhaH (DUF805 family)
MSFGQAITTCFRKYADFKGRASRPEYWWFLLSFVLAYLGVSIIGAGLGEDAAGGLLILLILGYLIPLLAAAVRRLHDTGRSGWYYFVGVIPLVGGFILLFLLAGMGESGSNMYGPPPGGPALPALQVPPPPPPVGL